MSIFNLHFEVPEQSGGRSPQTLEPVFAVNHVCTLDIEAADEYVQPILSNVWEGGKVYLRCAQRL